MVYHEMLNYILVCCLVHKFKWMVA